MAELTLQATIRKETGRKYAKAARRMEQVPGVFYTGNTKNVAIQVKRLDLRPVIYTSEMRVINLKLDDGSENRCILKDVQFDPVTDQVVHFDLIGLVAGEKLKVEVPIVLHGTSIGVRGGGILQHMLHHVEIECLPVDIPQHIEINIENLAIGDTVRISDISMPGITIHLDPATSIVHISAARGEEASSGDQSGEPKRVGEEE